MMSGNSTGTAEGGRDGTVFSRGLRTLRPTVEGLDILGCSGEGYRRVVDGPKWTVAALNYASRFDEKNIFYLERHNLTDETFVLLEGAASLLIGETAERVALEPLTCYNVRAGTWHNIIVSPGAHVLIAENSDTDIANSDYLELATRRIIRGVRPAGRAC